jgi:flagellar biosynthetic protein FliR
VNPDAATIAAFLLILTRTSAMVLAAPILGFGIDFSGFKLALIVFLSVAVYGALGEPVPVSVDGTYDLSPVALGAMAVREVLIGLFLAFLFHVVMLAVMVAGELVGQEMGFMMARQVDPATGVNQPLITSIYQNLFMLSLLAVNAHHWLVSGLHESFERAPVGQLKLGDGVAPLVQNMFGEMFGAGFAFAAPVLVLLGLVSILMGLLSRMVPHLNVLEVGFSMRILVASVAMFVFAPLLAPAMEALHQTLQIWMDRALDAVEV